MKKLKMSDLTRKCNLSKLPFKTTEDFEFDQEPLHQMRGVRAIDFGLNVTAEGYNIFVGGPSGTGRNTQVKKAVNEIAGKKPSPKDWLYVFNFVDEDEPIAIGLPSGRGIIFKKDMEELVGDLKVEIPKAFESEDYESRRQELLKEYKKKRDDTLEDVESLAFDEGFVLKQSATGVVLVPRVEDRAMSNEEYEELLEDEKNKIEKEKHKLHIKIEQVLAEVRALEKLAKKKIKELEREVALFSVKHIIDELRFKYQGFDDIVEYLDLVQEDVIDNIENFKEEEAGGQAVMFGMKPSPKKDVFKTYQVNLLVDNRQTKGGPVVIEPNPTYYNLLGRIEYMSHMGSMTTDFTMIAPGALHKANGGYLILQAHDVLTSFMAWDALKRVIRNHEIKVEDINEQFRMISTTSLKPKPIPCDIKIVMVGSPWLYQLLYKYDEGFRKMFKVKADFDIQMHRDMDRIKKYAAFIKVRCEEQGMRHFQRDAVAKIVEYGSRLMENQEKLSARFMDIADLLTESDYWAGKGKADYVDASHVEKAMQEKIYRSSLIEEKISELMEKGILLIDLKGERVGQVNGLAVLDIGEYAFGKPSRITAKTYIGRAGVVDIERQVKMGGDIHSKGVMILCGYLGEKFAQEEPLNLSASICFEQSYDGVDGDSASSTEAYCILSALAGVPIKQSIAVTGSMNQHGMIQPIGGVNEKIEGFYHTCKAKGLTGEQGVIIPKQNIRHLMLKKEVQDSVRDGKFHIWAVSSVDEGIEILTGRKAGKKGKRGKYPKESINYLVARRLKEYSDKGSGKRKDKDEPSGDGKKNEKKTSNG